MAAKVQFSLRMIFLWTAVVAVFAAEAVAFPEWLANIVGIHITLLLSPVFVAQIVYSRGAGRAFGIGALSMWLTVAWVDRLFGISFGIDRMDFCVIWLLTLAGGGVAVLVRWFSLANSSEET